MVCVDANESRVVLSKLAFSFSVGIRLDFT